MRWVGIAVVVMCGAVGAIAQQSDSASQPKMPALIGQALDKQLPKSPIDFHGTLPQAIANFGDLTGVRIEADGAVYDALPWGDLTTFNAKFEHQTLRQAIDAICRKLGLEYELGADAVLLHPLPALRRLGRPCTVEELAELDDLQVTALQPADSRMSVDNLLQSVDAKLKSTSYAVENRVFDTDGKTMVDVARNATLLDALEDISQQTEATWYPWGNTIVVLKKPDQIRMQLARQINTRFDGQDVSQVLLELSRQSGVTFQIDPGAVQRIPAEFRTIRLALNDVSIQQALESLAGFTGLQYTVTDDGVRISNPTAAVPATQPVH